MHRTLPFLACLLLAACLPQTAHGGKLHIVIAVDENDPTVGKYSQADKAKIVTAFSTQLPEGTYEQHVIPPAQMSKRGILNYVRRLKPTATDSILFYYSGHGGYNASKGHFLALRNNSEQLKRSDLLQALNSRNARFVALISEACFNLVKVSPRARHKGYAGKAVQIPALYRRLFFDIRGTIDLNGCRRDQKSMTFPQDSEGSLFTRAFTSQLERNKDTGSLGWQQFLELVREETNETFQRIYPSGVTIRTESGRQKQRSQDPDFVTAPRVQELGRQDIQRVTWTDTKIVIDPDSGAVSEITYLKTFTPETGRTQSTVQSQKPLGRARLITGRNGIKLWNHEDLYVIANPDRYPPVRPSDGQRVPLGIFVANSSRPGAKITSVGQGTPAERMHDLDTGESLRLKAGDHILSVNGVAVYGKDDVIRLVNASPVDLRLEVVDVRTGKTRRLATRLVANTGPGPHDLQLQRPVGDRLGVSCRNCPDGIHVDAVYPNRPASKMRDDAGRIIFMEKGDHIVALNGRSVRTVEQLADVMANSPARTTISVKDVNSGRVATFRITLD